MELSAADLENLLLQMTRNNTDVIKQAEAILTQFLKKSSCVPALMQQIQGSQHADARQLASIYLRKKIGGFWKKLKADSKGQVKLALLQRLAEEPLRVVRNGIIGVVGTIAKIEVPANHWNELLDFLLQMSRNEQAVHRETAILLFRVLAEEIGHALKPHFAVLQSIFLTGLADPESSKVRGESLKALGCMIELLETEKEMLSFRQVIPPMIEGLRANLTGDDDEAVTAAFEVFDELASSDVPVINPHVPALVRFLLEVVANTQLDLVIRDRAKSLVVIIICCKPKKVVNNNLIPDILQASFTVAVENFDESESDLVDISPQLMATEMIDMMTEYLDPSTVYNLCIANVRGIIRSPDPCYRRGGLLIMATLAQNCELDMKEQLEELLSDVCNSVQDPEGMVREAAAKAIAHFADHLQPEIIEHHQTVLPALFIGLETSREPIVLGKTCVALETYVQNLEGGQIVPYLQPLMEKMLVLLSTVNNRTVQRTVISAISAAAASAREHFRPYYEQMVVILKELMQQNGDDELRLRAKATACVGNVAVAVGREMFAPVLEPFFQLVVDGFKLNFCEIRECSYGFFSSMSELLREDFLPYLPTVLPLVLATMDSDEGVNPDTAPEDEIQTGDIGTDSEEETPDQKAERLNRSGAIQEGYLDEKSAAIHCLASLFQFSGQVMFPFLPRCLTSLEDLVDFPHHFIRQSVVTAFQELLSLAGRSFPLEGSWVKGVSSPLPQQAQELVDFVMPKYIFVIKEDDDRETAAMAVDAVAALVHTYGMGCLDKYINELGSVLLTILQEKAVCQRTVDEEADQEAVIGHDHYLLEATIDLIEVMAETCGLQFAPIFKEFSKSLMKFTKKGRSAGDRAMVIGCFACVIPHIGEHALQYIDKLMPLLLSAASEKDEQLRQNMSFCCGVLVENAGVAMVPFYNTILGAIQPFLQLPDPPTVLALRVKDNAVSAVSKIIMADAGKGTVSLPDVIALFLSGLPIQVDFAEATASYSCLIHLFQTSPQLLLPHTPQIVLILCDVLDNGNVAPAIRQQLTEIGKSLFQQLGAQLEPVLANLSPAQRNKLQQYLS